MDFLTFKNQILEFSKNNGFFPVSFSIPKCKLLKEIPKEKNFARTIPGIISTYGFKTEAEYMHDYSISKASITIKKAGWDCLRHLEIMAANCIPILADMCYCPGHCLYFYPKNEFKFALENLNNLFIDQVLYQNLLDKIKNHLENYLTCESMIKNIFDILEVKPQNILFIDDKLPTQPDYLSDMILIGLKNNFGKNCEVAFPVDYLYKSSLIPNDKLHGQGFSYSKVLEEELKTDHEKNPNINQIEDNIRDKKYDLIVFGSLTRSNNYLNFLLANYNKNQIVSFIGEDYSHNYFQHIITTFKDKLNLFIREVYI